MFVYSVLVQIVRAWQNYVNPNNPNSPNNPDEPTPVTSADPLPLHTFSRSISGGVGQSRGRTVKRECGEKRRLVRVWRERVSLTHSGDEGDEDDEGDSGGSGDEGDEGDEG